MALLESKETKRARRQVAIRMAKRTVERYTADCRRMAERYLLMAKKALALGKKSQCNQYLYHRISYQQQSAKWESFLLKMEDLTLRGQMSGAMSNLVRGMQALNKEVRAGVSPKEMTKTIRDVNVTMDKLGQTEDQLTGAMEGLDFEVGSSMDTETSTAIPTEMQEQIDDMRNELMGEVTIQERIGESGAGESLGNRSSETDERIKKSRDRIKKIKNETK